ncbi:hypothetical protein ZIOFF_040206 [Zingiber officinale]|uniref:Uncharacterized protein n=1 Tax=Zingiber officinale TaxID=94328 RepID=A0A8J5G5S9_ZINOF|nr:hypothetical protein ZIOFF_040206 [Zingiber officinale]
MRLQLGDGEEEGGGGGMANKLKMFRNTNQTQRFRFVVLVIGCLVVSMTFIMISRPLDFPSFGLKIRRAGPSDVEGEKIAPTLRDDDQSSKESVSEKVTDLLRVSEKYQEENDLQGKKVDSITDPNKDEKPETDEAFESTSETEEEGTKNGGNSDQDESHSRMTLPTISNYTINDLAQVENKTTTPEQPGKSTAIEVHHDTGTQ